VGVTETDSGAETGIKEDGASDARPMRKPTLSSLSSDIGESRVDKSSPWLVGKDDADRESAAVSV